MRWRLPFNQGSPKIQAIVGIVVVLFVIALATRCSAEESYSQFGVGQTVIRGEASAVDLSFAYPDAAPGDATLEVGATFIGESDFRGNQQRNNFALRAAVIERLRALEIGIGTAYLQNVDTFNGSHLNFNLVFGCRFERVPITVRWQHFSNGGTASPNKGRDMVLVLWRFR